MKSSVGHLRDSHSVKCDLASEVLRTTGRLRLQVNGWSMLPGIFPGDTLELEGTRREALSSGDIVLFRRDRRLFVHRILTTGRTIVMTRGDAMAQADPAVAEDQVLCRVTCIVRDGKCIKPRKSLSVAQRAVAGVARSSGFGARVVVGIRGLLRDK